MVWPHIWVSTFDWLICWLWWECLYMSGARPNLAHVCLHRNEARLDATALYVPDSLLVILALDVSKHAGAAPARWAQTQWPKLLSM